MNKKELAEYAGVSVTTVNRGLSKCLQPFRLGGQVFYDKAQVERHFANVLKNHGKCDGNCAEAPKPQPEIQKSFRRKSKSWKTITTNKLAGIVAAITNLWPSNACLMWWAERRKLFTATKADISGWSKMAACFCTVSRSKRICGCCWKRVPAKANANLSSISKRSKCKPLKTCWWG